MVEASVVGLGVMAFGGALAGSVLVGILGMLAKGHAAGAAFLLPFFLVGLACVWGGYHHG